MINLKNKLILTAVMASSLTFNAQAASFVSNDAQNLTQCREMMQNKIGEVERMKSSNIKSKSRSFSVKYKVTKGGERSVVQCTLAKGQEGALSCLKGSLCDSF